jgi:hypothetical protein
MGGPFDAEGEQRDGKGPGPIGLCGREPF